MRKHRPMGRVPPINHSTYLDSSPDITYIMDKFPKTKSKSWLAIRAGNAISQRRDSIRYRQTHRKSLAKPPQHHLPVGFSPGDTSTLRDTVVATTFQESTPDKPLDRMHVDEQLDETRSNLSAFTSGTSFLTQDEDAAVERRIPDLSEMILDGVQLQYGNPFECPYCRTIQATKNRQEWKYVFIILVFIKPESKRSTIPLLP